MVSKKNLIKKQTFKLLLFFFLEEHKEPRTSILHFLPYLSLRTQTQKQYSNPETQRLS